ncbi:MAG: argininosuccinate lyase [Acidobacteriota bacterium]|jgi:argininosuccinate lyase|nr:argininosuccinate lyase [Acidobacteriota bacterium]
MSLLRGLFDGDEDDLFRVFASSLEMDLWIAEEDIEGSIAHVTTLGEVGVLSSDEAATLVDGLAQILVEFRNGSWTPDESQEDIHMAVEARLTEIVGEVGGKLHTARSRNDQVATDVRLWLIRRLGTLAAAVGDLITTLLDRVETDGQVLLPGYTHLQRGQPILLGHHLLAHAWALSRDLERIQDVTARVDRCPLGAGALAGTPHPINRQRTAVLLGFSGPIENAMDAVASKDHLQETVSACAICMSTLSRMAEELVLWSSAEFAFIQLAERHTTSSSIMPQKRNPDGAELVRGETGVVFGHLQALLTLTKAMPLAYNRDLQTERKPLVESVLRTTASVRLLAAMWNKLDVRTSRFESELYGDFSLATELADLLVERGVPFREAHGVVAKAVRWCEEQGGNLTLLDGGAAQRFHPEFPPDLGLWLDPRAAAGRRTSFGGTASCEIERQALLLRKLVKELALP